MKNERIKNYLNTKIKLNALIAKMKKYGTVNATLTVFSCFDDISYQQQEDYRELNKTLYYIKPYFINYAKAKKYIIDNAITLESAQAELEKWSELKFTYDMIDTMNHKQSYHYDDIIRKVNRYTQIIDILTEGV